MLPLARSAAIKPEFDDFDIVDFKTGGIERFSALELLIQQPIPWLSIYRKGNEVYRTKVVQENKTTEELPKKTTHGLKALTKLKPKIDGGHPLTARQKPDIIDAKVALASITKRHARLIKKEAKIYFEKHDNTQIADDDLRRDVAFVTSACLEPSSVFSIEIKDKLPEALKRIARADEEKLPKAAKNALAEIVHLRNRDCFTHAAMQLNKHLLKSLQPLRGR